jgi:hypothetical protein
MRVTVRLGLLLAGISLGLASTAQAEDVTVPVELQIGLLAKVAAYDHNLPARAGDKVITLVVVKESDGGSVRTGSRALEALNEKRELAGLPHEAQLVAYKSAAALAAQSRRRHASILYLASGFSDAEVVEIESQLGGQELLTVAAIGRQVQSGMILGFDLEAGKPKLLFSLPQATRHGVSVSANVLSLMTVYR